MTTTTQQYSGYLLVANPANPSSDVSHGVILVVSHKNGRAVGIQINNAINNMDIRGVAENLGMDYHGPISPVYHGGAMNHARIHIVHSSDWQGSTTVPITSEISMTADISILSAIAAGEGPRSFRACAGYCLWENHGLERQLDSRSYPDEIVKWEVVPATTELVFDCEGHEQWQLALTESALFSAAHWF